MNDEEDIQKLFDAYKAAVHAKDVDRFVAMYENDVQAFDMWGRCSYVGADQWRAMADQWFSSLGGERVAVEFHQIRTAVGERVAAAHAFVTFKGFASDGKPLHSMDNRLTWVLRKAPHGAWKIVHQHTSAPIDSVTSKSSCRGR